MTYRKKDKKNVEEAKEILASIDTTKKLDYDKLDVAYRALQTVFARLWLRQNGLKYD